MQEQWKDIPNYEGLYKISNLGNIKSLDRLCIANDSKDLRLVKGQIIKQRQPQKYKIVSLRDGVTQKSFLVHRLVFHAFKGYLPNKPNYVDHIDRNKDNNHISNLRELSPTNSNYNTGIRSDNKSGKIGVGYVEARRKWRARLTKQGRIIQSFHTSFEEACMARDRMEQEEGVIRT